MKIIKVENKYMYILKKDIFFIIKPCQLGVRGLCINVGENVFGKLIGYFVNKYTETVNACWEKT